VRAWLHRLLHRPQDDAELPVIRGEIARLTDRIRDTRRDLIGQQLAAHQATRKIRTVNLIEAEMLRGRQGRRQP
jgi:hypothetical protein